MVTSFLVAGQGGCSALQDKLNWMESNDRMRGAGEVVVVVLLFIVSWLLRRPAPESPPNVAFVLSFLGVAIALVTGWLGGELVDRLGVGVDNAANLNAPSSLSGQPATSAPDERRVRRVS